MNQTLTFSRLELIEIELPLVEQFTSAIGERTARRALLVKWIDREGNFGIGECSCRPDPFFNGEFNRGAIEIIRTFCVPYFAKEAMLSEYIAVLQRIRNWPFTVAAVLDAGLDLCRRQGGEDFFDKQKKLSGIAHVGISLGIFDSASASVERVQKAIDKGYRRVKFKVHPEMQMHAIEAVRIAFPDVVIGFDANGSGTEGDIGFFTSLQKYHPTFIEQPFAPSRLDLCSKLKKEISECALCLDESVTDLGTLVSAHRMDAIDELNLKPGRVGGQLETLRILDFCSEHSIPLWVGGMFETGVGRSANLRLAARLGGGQVHDLSPGDRYFERDILTQPIRMLANGVIEIDEEPVELDLEFLNQMTVNKFI